MSDDDRPAADRDGVDLGFLDDSDAVADVDGQVAKLDAASIDD